MKIAIIGNSRDVLKHAKGEKVDSANLVIRINSFRTRGVEQFTGSRTDVVSICLAPWVVANALTPASHTLRMVPTVWTPSWRGHAEDHEVAAAMEAIGHKPDKLVFSDHSGDAEAMRDLYERFFAAAEARPGPKTMAEDGKRLLPTTGFLTVHLARLRFPQATVQISGFGLDTPLDLERFDESGVSMWPGHDIATERQWFLDGAQEGEWELI